MQERNDIMSVDAMMDERYGKVGTPEREAFRKEAYAYCGSQGDRPPVSLTVFLNVVQESQELLSALRHLMRGENKFVNKLF